MFFNIIKYKKEKISKNNKDNKINKNSKKCKDEKENLLEKQIDKLNKSLIEKNMIFVLELLGDRKRFLFVNLSAGIIRGIGIGIGVTIITAILLILLRKLVTLNIPIIGQFVSDIVEIVEKTR